MQVIKKTDAVFTAKGDAFDIGNYETVTFKEENPILKIATGLKLQLDTPAFILPRSGLALHLGRAFMIANSPGFIDVDYRGEINIIIDIDSALLYKRLLKWGVNAPIIYKDSTFIIPEKTRIAQLKTDFETLSIRTDEFLFRNFKAYYPTERSDTGFGASGYK